LQIQPPSVPASGSSGQDTSWFVFVAWTEYESGGGFAYGCASPASARSDWNETTSIDIPGGANLHVYQCIISHQLWVQLRVALDAGMLDTESLHVGKVVHAKVRATRFIFQEGFGQSGVRTLLHHTLPNVEDIVGTADGALDCVLTALQDQLNLPFKGRYATHLGNFEIFELHPWLDGPAPFLVEGAQDSEKDSSGPQTREISRSIEFCRDEHIAHLVSEVNGEVIFDRLIKLPAGERRTAFELPETPSRLHFRLFSANGDKLLHSEHQTFLNRIHIVMAPVARQLTIEDELTHRAKSQNKELGKKAASVVTHSSHRSAVGAPREGSWQKFVEDMERRVANQLPKSGEDKWFTRGIDSEVGAIAHIAGLIDGGHITHAVLVDPWFGADALQRFALRISSHNVRFTILTSWTDEDPDTGNPFERDKSPTAKLEAVLQKIEPLLAPSLRIINLVDGKAQAFHDRYLVLYPYETPPKTFLLSNSINKLAGNWPFAMSLLAPDVGREVQRYVEALLAGTDSARNRALNITFDWPSNAT